MISQSCEQGELLGELLGELFGDKPNSNWSGHVAAQYFDWSVLTLKTKSFACSLGNHVSTAKRKRSWRQLLTQLLGPYGNGDPDYKNAVSSDLL